jgi:hypothetical protein
MAHVGKQEVTDLLQAPCGDTQFIHRVDYSLYFMGFAYGEAACKHDVTQTRRH